MRFLATWLDLPPVWLALFGVTAWGQSQLLPALSFGKWADWVGAALVGAGVLIAVSAIAQFFGKHTSVVPRRTPSTLIRSGIYRLTRNPIYLADAMILGGLILRWDAVLSVVLVPVFMVLIQRRFINGEEIRIREEFGEVFDAYALRVRRWL